MLVSVDFDGTCVTHMYPQTGFNIGAEVVLKELTNNGHSIICVSMRSDNDKKRCGIDTLENIRLWFNENGIPLQDINDNKEQGSWTSSRKIYAHTYIDDQFLGAPLKHNKLVSERPFIDWIRASQMLYEIGLLSLAQVDKVDAVLRKKYPNIYKE